MGSRRRSPALLEAVAVALLLAGSAHAQGNSSSDGSQQQSGPKVTALRRNPAPRPSGGDIQVAASAEPQGSQVTAVTLVYVTNYGTETRLPMSQTSGGNYTATIPASAAPPGAMVRWRVEAADGAGRTASDPPPPGSKGGRQYYGTVVEDTSDKSSLPVLELYCKDEKAPYDTSTKTSPGLTSNKTATPGCSLFFNGSFYDNLIVKRLGQSSLNWPKPKLEVDSGSQGKIFRFGGRPYALKEFKLNSEWAEPGENTFMRETLAWETFRQMGVDSVLAFQSQVRLNGKYYGKFAFTEKWSADALAHNGYTVAPQPGPLMKSESGEYGNLRWDIPSDQVQFYYSDEFKTGPSAAAALVDLGRGLAGGGGVPRSKFLFDAVDLPRTINQLAAQTVVLNQDRCTKNFLVYRDPSSRQWSMLPWDVESAFTNDRGLGGGPAADYCSLACEQWNSPLYCDRNHPQDLAVKTPWGLITTQLNFGGAAPAGRKMLARAGAGARALQQDGSGSGSGSGTTPGTSVTGAAAPGLSLPQNSTISADYDADQTKKGPTPAGAPGTFNYMVDAILAVPRTRAMYMRRVRSLMDGFIMTERLQGLVTAEYTKVRDEAKRDAAKWGNPGDPDRGYKSLVTEQLPIRRDQLYNKYGPSGDTPLIPDAQPSAATLSIGGAAAGGDGYVQALNAADVALDVSGWKLSGGGVAFTFLPGTVVPAGDSVYVAAGSVGAFKARSSGPRGGQGLFVVGPLSGTPDGSTLISISRP